MFISLNKIFSKKIIISTFKYNVLDKKVIYNNIMFQSFSSFNKDNEVDVGMIPIQDIADSIDTTLTKEQQEYVDKLKKKIKGGSRSPRSLYRDVPLQHEIVGLGNFMPRIAENAEELINYALSHIPPKAGKRGSRRKKRMFIKQESKRKLAALTKLQKSEANLKRHQRLKRIKEEVKQMKEEVKRIQEIKKMKAEILLKRNTAMSNAM